MIEDARWILNNSLSDANYKQHLAEAPLEEIEYCLTKEKRKTGRIQLEWEKEKRIRDNAKKEKEAAETRRQEEWNKTVEAMPPPPKKLNRVDLFGKVIETYQPATSTSRMIIQGKEPADYEEDNDEEPFSDEEMPEEEVEEDE